MTENIEIKISKAMIEQYNEDGYFILERVLSATNLQLLRSQCHHFIDMEDAEMEKAGLEFKGPNQKGKRYFINLPYRTSSILSQILFSDLMAEICRATIGQKAFLFFEQFVTKSADGGTKFAWHQDSGYVPFAHQPFVTCWFALDDMSEENGTVSILPYSQVESNGQYLKHKKNDQNTDLVGYHGDKPGIPAIIPAGSMAIFSSTTLHRSGANTSNRMRRAYVAQYAPEPISDKTKPSFECHNIPFRYPTAEEA